MASEDGWTTLSVEEKKKRRKPAMRDGPPKPAPVKTSTWTADFSIEDFQRQLEQEDQMIEQQAQQEKDRITEETERRKMLKKEAKRKRRELEMQKKEKLKLKKQREQYEKQKKLEEAKNKNKEPSLWSLTKPAKLTKKDRERMRKAALKEKEDEQRRREKAMRDSKRQKIDASSQGVMQKCFSVFSSALKHLLVFAVAFVFVSMYISQSKSTLKSKV